jgi:2-dehydropantoate 2-reductase
MHVADRLDEQTAYDLVVVTVLAYLVDSLLPVLQRSKAHCIHFMFVTFEPERLMEAIGSNRCTFGMPALAATMNSDGKLKPTINPRQKTQHSEQRLVDLFSEAGVPSVFEADMMLWLRCHVPLCIAFESIAVAGQRRGGGATFGEAMVVARGLHSGFAIVKALDHTLYPSAKSTINSLPTFMIAFLMWVFSRVPSMRELLATGLNECRALIDTMMAVADKAKLAAPKDMKAVLAMRPAK